MSRNIYRTSSISIQKKLIVEYNEFIAVRKLVNRGNMTETTKDRYSKIFERKDKLYDIYSESDKDKAKQG